MPDDALRMHVATIAYFKIFVLHGMRDQIAPKNSKVFLRPIF